MKKFSILGLQKKIETYRLMKICTIILIIIRYHLEKLVEYTCPHIHQIILI